MDIVVVEVAVVGGDLRLEDCRPPVLLEALAEAMGKVKEANHRLEAPRQQMLLKIVPLGRDNNFSVAYLSIFFFFFVHLQTGFSFLSCS